MKLLLLIAMLALPQAHPATENFVKEYYGYVFNEYTGVSYEKGTKARAFYRFAEKQKLIIK